MNRQDSMTYTKHLHYECKVSKAVVGIDRPSTHCHSISIKIVSEYDQEIPQLQTAENPVVPRGRAAQPSRDIRKTN